MRPKLVELTNEKLELSERIEGLEKQLRARDSTIEGLEVSSEQLRQEKEEIDRNLKNLEATLSKEQSSRQETFSELQEAYSNLQAELDATRQELQNLQSSKAALVRTTAEQKEELFRVTAASQAKDEQLLSLQRELEERTEAQAEDQDFLEHARTELENLRREV
ncbi:hypothetical protein GLOTRDRAFT_30795, partial [Gloeophyllum trabeum ATCC 11539]